ncbi:hypothetical protein OE88DRAFT_1624744 [Heliocybe sulcata]|uniref:Reverse transcriptase domain-containing protein n=1 Tax=Heliocybe sulcata TaxID=5364 RepID=A0A5C3NBS9_9AGAM|nr:hypothetical protein OE88DRAFT_1624744 [Heliocybe sulcata]
MLQASPTIHGFQVPGILDNVLVTLFADDTTVYLRKADRYADLILCLETWCRASGARFNSEKTEIIPVGSASHRSRVLTTRCLHPDDTPLPASIHIAQDGEAVRSLGAWIGNNVDNSAPWEATLDKVNHTLTRFLRGHPTLFEKTHLIQATVGGMTQYLTKVQGMPPPVEDALVKITRRFIWEENSSNPPIALDHLYKPATKGGLSLLDLKARNDAIELTWLRAYLDLSPHRPTWAFVTDLLLNVLAPDGIAEAALFNTFLQKWDVPLAGHRAARLPQDVLLMLRTARCYGVAFAPRKLSSALKRQLPAFYLLGAPPHTYIAPKIDCLIHEHAAKTIHDLLRVSNRLRDPPRFGTHHPRRNCACSDCTSDRHHGCANPH